MPRVIRSLFLLALVAGVLGGCSYSQNATKKVLPEQAVFIGKNKLEVEVANTEASRIHGLSGRDFLSANRGMLFTFDSPGHYEFWMHEMKIPLDIIWVSKGVVVGTAEKLSPPSAAAPEPVRVMPPEPVDAVVEVSSGWVEMHRVMIGDIITSAP